jgi:RNA polymerase sigma-70 factor, ECF subfamily
MNAKLPRAAVPEALTDGEVIRRVLAGEIQLFEIVMRRYNQRLYRAARAILRDDAEAEAAVQEAYISAYTHLGQFEGRASFSTWLTRIAVHEALSRGRRRNRWASLDSVVQENEEMYAAPGRGPEQEALNSELRTMLEQSIEALPMGYRSVFVLRDVEGLDTAETAECLGLTEENVKTRLHRARAMLREALFDRAGAAASSAFELHLDRCDRIVRRFFQSLRARPSPGIA